MIGDVTRSEEASIRPNIVFCGVNGHIEVGDRTTIQDNAVCHDPTEIDPDVTVGHRAIVHAVTVEERASIGMGVVLDNAHVGHHSIIGAGSVVTEGTAVPPHSFVVGAPAMVNGEVSDSKWSEG
ncbi:MAG: gamma carbonic anhydrase family protein, partial [Halobacteriales archaeon]|nr:gamma carbonic anhydrase family protein [Halobacteriales archaeon]